MKRDKNGRFQKKSHIEIDIPSLISIIKYSLIILIFSPWIYMIFYKFDGIGFLKLILTSMFGPAIVNEERVNKSPEEKINKSPY